MKVLGVKRTAFQDGEKGKAMKRRNGKIAQHNRMGERTNSEGCGKFVNDLNEQKRGDHRGNGLE